MVRLIQQFEAERSTNAVFNDTVESLQRYGESVDEGPPMGLEEKLRVAERDAEYRRAVRFKEAFHKKLTKHRLSKAAQEILGYVMARVEVSFQNQIEPLIDAGVDREVVQRALLEGVIGPVEDLLGDNPLLLDAAEVMGMIYYLTGNCHIRWHRT